MPDDWTRKKDVEKRERLKENIAAANATTDDIIKKVANNLRNIGDDFAESFNSKKKTNDVDVLRNALLKSEEYNTQLKSKNIISNKNYIQLSQENTLLKSKNFQLSNQILNLEGQVEDFKKLATIKENLIENQGHEIDGWQIKFTEMERVYENRLKEATAEIARLREASGILMNQVMVQNNEKEVVKAPLVKNNKENDNSAINKLEISENESNMVQNTIQTNNSDIVTKECQNVDNRIYSTTQNNSNLKNSEIEVNDVNQYKIMINNLSKQYLANRTKLIEDYENLFSNFKDIKDANLKDDMNMIYVRKVEERLQKFIENRIFMDQTITDLQIDKIALEEHIFDCKRIWAEQEKKLEEKISYLENNLRKYSNINKAKSDDLLSDSGKLVYVRSLLMQFLLTKDWDIKQGMLSALQKLLDLTDQESHTLKHSL